MNSNDLEYLEALIKEAGQAVLKYYKSSVAVSYKKDQSPVTDADKVSQTIILKGLKRFKLPVLAEEESDHDPAHYLHESTAWIVDPLDGTSDFIEQNGQFTILIGLIQSGRPTLGLVYQPEKDILYFAQKDQGAFKKTKSGIQRIYTSTRKQLSQLKMLTSRHHLQPIERQFAATHSLSSKKLGSAGLKLAKIAEGKADLYISAGRGTAEWDTCAASIILEEAGGKITDLLDRPLRYQQADPIHAHGFIASNDTCHQQILKAFQQL